MSDEATIPAPTPNQQRRWMIYGTNVGLCIVMLIALAVLLTYLAQAHAVRIDTTTGGTQSLRPQTVSFIHDLKQKVRIVALYRRLKSDAREQDYYQPVADLLSDYASKGHNITTEIFYPDTEKDRFNALVTEVTSRFGGEAKGYKAVLDQLQTPVDTLGAFAAGETARFKKLPLDKVQDQDILQGLDSAYLTLIGIPGSLKQLKTATETDMGQQIPSYKRAVDDVRTAFTNISQMLDIFQQYAASLKLTQGLPRDFQDYSPGAVTRAAAAKQVVADVLKQISQLPELKELSEFRDQLKSQSILVMTDTGYKILPFEQVWKQPEASRYEGESESVAKLSFAGEQQISMAIAALTGGQKPLVVFVRPGGGPLANPGGAEQQVGPFAAVAQRLRDYNFEVKEKDASGQWAAEQPENAALEATDADMQRAVWVVLRSPQDSASGTSPIGPMLAQHLSAGGSALVLLFPQTDTMSNVLNEWGIQAMTDYLIVHAVMPPTGRRSNDLVDGAMQESQLIFKLNQYGQHPLARPLEGLDMLVAANVPVKSTYSTFGATVTPLLPFPTTPHTWATMDLKNGLASQRLVFDPKPNVDAGRPQGDLESTSDSRLYGAAASEKTGGGRLVVVGSFWFATNDPVNLADSDMREKHGLTVARLPGNGEFFVDSVLWLAHKDSLLAISPHSLQMARLREMSPGSLAALRLGVLIVGIPLAVIMAGVVVYMQRRN